MSEETKETKEIKNPYLANTEEPVIETPATAESAGEPKKNPAVKVVIILAILAVILVVAIVALVVSGLFGDKKGKIAQAFKNTFVQSGEYLEEVWQIKEYEGMFENKECSGELSLTMMEEVTVDATIDSTEDATGIYLDLGMAGSSMLKLEAYADESKIYAVLPEYFDYLFYVDLENLEDDIQVMVENGMLDAYTADSVTDALEMKGESVELSEEAVEKLEADINAAWAKMYEAVSVKEIASEEFEVNSETVKCDGYAIEVTPAILADIAEDSANAYLENEEVMAWLERLEKSYDTNAITEGITTLKEQSEELREMDEEEAEDATFYVNVYLYDEQVAYVEATEPGEEDTIWFAWAIEGGSYPLENSYIELTLDGDEIEIYRNSSFEDGEYWVEYELVDAYGTSYILDTYYTPETGEFEVDVMEDDYWNLLYTYGTFAKVDDHTIEVEIETLEVDEEEILYGEITLMDECGEIQKPEGGEELNIFTLTEEEWTALIMEAYMALY